MLPVLGNASDEQWPTMEHKDAIRKPKTALVGRAAHVIGLGLPIQIVTTPSRLPWMGLVLRELVFVPSPP